MPIRCYTLREIHLRNASLLLRHFGRLTGFARDPTTTLSFMPLTVSDARLIVRTVLRGLNLLPLPAQLASDQTLLGPDPFNLKVNVWCSNAARSIISVNQ